MDSLTPPAPTGEPLITPPPEGTTQPTPVAGETSWFKGLAQSPAQAGLI